MSPVAIAQTVWLCLCPSDSLSSSLFPIRHPDPSSCLEPCSAKPYLGSAASGLSTLAKKSAMDFQRTVLRAFPLHEPINKQHDQQCSHVAKIFLSHWHVQFSNPRPQIKGEHEVWTVFNLGCHGSWESKWNLSRICFHKDFWRSSPPSSCVLKWNYRPVAQAAVEKQWCRCRPTVVSFLWLQLSDLWFDCCSAGCLGFFLLSFLSFFPLPDPWRVDEICRYQFTDLFVIDIGPFLVYSLLPKWADWCSGHFFKIEEWLVITDNTSLYAIWKTVGPHRLNNCDCDVIHISRSPLSNQF